MLSDRCVFEMEVTCSLCVLCVLLTDQLDVLVLPRVPYHRKGVQEKNHSLCRLCISQGLRGTEEVQREDLGRDKRVRHVRVEIFVVCA